MILADRNNRLDLRSPSAYAVHLFQTPGQRPLGKTLKATIKWHERRRPERFTQITFRPMSNPITKMAASTTAWLSHGAISERFRE